MKSKNEWLVVTPSIFALIASMFAGRIYFSLVAFLVLLYLLSAKRIFGVNVGRDVFVGLLIVFLSGQYLIGAAL